MPTNDLVWQNIRPSKNLLQCMSLWKTTQEHTSTKPPPRFLNQYIRAITNPLKYKVNFESALHETPNRPRCHLPKNSAPYMMKSTYGLKQCTIGTPLDTWTMNHFRRRGNNFKKWAIQAWMNVQIINKLTSNDGDNILAMCRKFKRK